MNTALSSIGDRLWDATQTVGDFLSGGKTAEIRGEKVAKSIGLGKEEVQKRAELSADDFLPVSAVLSANRNSLASQRNTEVNRLLTLPKTDAKTGAGTLAAFSSSAGQASVELPEEIPQSPTAFQLAKQLSNQQVVEELLNSGIVESRKGGVAKSAMRGINRGVTLGIVGQRDMESPYTQAQLQQEPMTSGQQNAEIAGELAGSFVPYAGIAKVVGTSFRSVAAINRFATANPFLFGATVSNLGEELVDMSVRKGTGQEYNQNDFILGLSMGGAFEGVFAGVRSMKNARLIQAQLNTAASQLKEATPKALYEAVKNQRVDGLDITYESLFKEHRLAFYRQAGREGIDRPSRPPNPDDVKPLSEYNPENAMDTLTLQKTADQLGTTTEKLREVVEEAGSDVNDIGAALQKNFPKYDELMAQIQKGIDDGDLPIGAVDIADPLRKSVFGRTVNGVAPKATGLIGGGDSVGGGVEVPLEPLMKEARKYKSAEEFVKAQGETLYHGTNEVFDRFDLSKARFKGEQGDNLWGFGVYTSPNRGTASQYGKNVLEIPFTPKKPLDLSRFKTTTELADYLDMSEDALVMRNGMPTAKGQQAAQFSSKAKMLGHDVIVAGQETVILEPSNIRTKAQLTDLWKKANNPSGKMDLGTMLPRETGERRLPGLRGDKNLKVEKTINDNNAYARKVVKPYVDQYLEFKRSIRTGIDIGEEGIGSVSGGDFASGQALRKHMELLQSRGVFKYKNITDVGALDADGAYKLLTDAWDYHQGKPAQALIGQSRPRGMETFSEDGAALLEEGYRSGPDDEAKSLYDNFRSMVDDGYEGITIDTLDFDGKGTSVRQLLHDLEQGAIQRSERAAATRSLNAQGKRNIVSDAGVRGEAEVRTVKPPQKEEILPEQAKAFAKPVRSEADIEIMFEPTMRGHLADFVNKTLNSRYISSFGNEGKAIAGMIDKADEIANIKIGIDVDELSPIMRGMNEVEIARFPDIAEGKIMPETPKEIALFDFWSTRRAEIAEQAQRSGLTVRGTDGIDRPFVPRDNYYPRVVNEARLKEIRSNPEKANAMFISMMEKSNGAIESITEAKKIFNNIIKDRTQKRYGNLERAREVDFLPDDMLIRDPRKVLSSYLQGARKRIADAQTLGPKQENAIRLIEDARVRGGDADTMLELLRRATGEEIFNQGEVQLSRIARTYNNFSKLSLAAVTNMGDVVKPFVRSGEFFTTLKGIVKSFTEEGATQARRSGAVEANLRSLLEDAGDTKWSDAFFKYTGFTMTETKVRSFNANAAVAHAEALVKRLSRNPDNAFAYRRLAQWLEDPDAAIKRGFLTQTEKDVVGFRGIADTQPLRRLDIPFYWQRPGVKVLTQFKTFAYKHMTFMKKFVVDEARQGNVRPLIAFLVMGQIVGETVGDMKAAIRNRDRPDDVTRRIIDNYMTIGGIGLATDFLSNLQYGSLGGGFLKFVAGPTLTDVDDWLTRIVSKNRAERIPKKVVGMVPLIGPAAAQTLYPSKNTYNARTIPIAEDILQLLEPSSSTSGRSSNASSRLPSRRSSTRLNPYR